MQHPEVQMVLLHHPSISKDQQVLLQLLQTSKDLAAAAKQQCSGQLPAALCTDHPHHVLWFAHRWLPKHAGLLQSLELQLEDHSDIRAYDGGTAKWSAAVEEVAEALKLCARQRLQNVTLQSLTLSGCPPGPLLLHLPAEHLTRLCAAVDFSSADSARHVARLTELRILDMSGGEPYKDSSDGALAPLCRLQHLTELHIGCTYTRQLKVPPALQQLHMTIDINCHSGQLVELASWLQQHGSVVRSLSLENVQRKPYWDPVWEEKLAEMTAGVGPGFGSMAAAGTAEGGAADAAAPGPTAAQVQLAHLHVEGHTALGLALQHLPASGSLTSLECRADFGRAAQQLSAVLRHTALRRLQLWGTVYSGAGGDGAADCFDDDVLSPLTGLTQLTQLRLGTVRAAQLSHLPVQLAELRASLFGGSEEDAEEEQPEPQQDVLQIGHLTALTSLIDCDAYESGEYGDECLRSHPLGPLDVLPPALQQLQWQGNCHSVTPLLPLQRLRQLELYFDEEPPPGPQLVQMSSMAQLTELRLVYSCADTYDAAAADAWAVLPLRRLKLIHWAASHASNKPPVVAGDVVGRLSALTQLTCLEVGIRMLFGSLGAAMHATPGQLAAALAPLTGLQQLELTGFGKLAADLGTAAAAGASSRPTRANKAGRGGSAQVAAQHGAAGVVALLDAVAGLKRMQQMRVELPLAMGKHDAASSAAAAKRMPSWVAEARVWEEGLLLKV
jgi:hypothetical protein